MKSDGLGAGRLSRKPRPVRRVERFGAPMVSETSCFTRFLRTMTFSVQFVFVILLAKTLFFEGFALQTPSVAVFAEGQELKSQTALGNRWPGAATSDPDLNTTGSITRKHCKLQGYL